MGITRKGGKYLYQKGRQALAGKIGEPGTKFVEALLFNKKSSASATVTPAKALKGTAMASYLDKKYEKKCGVEIKRIYQSVGATVIGTSIALLYQHPLTTTLPQGLTDTSRVGSTVEVKSIRFNCTLVAAPTQTVDERVRIIIVKMGKNAGAVALPGSILASTGDIRSPLQDRDDRTTPYTVLKDMTFTLGSPVTQSPRPNRIDFVINYRPKSCHQLTFTRADTTGLTGNMTEGQVAIYAMYENLGGAAAVPTLQYYSRYEYTDV